MKTFEEEYEEALNEFALPGDSARAERLAKSISAVKKNSRPDFNDKKNFKRAVNAIDSDSNARNQSSAVLKVRNMASDGHNQAGLYTRKAAKKVKARQERLRAIKGRLNKTFEESYELALEATLTPKTKRAIVKTLTGQYGKQKERLRRKSHDSAMAASEVSNKANDAFHVAANVAGTHNPKNPKVKPYWDDYDTKYKKSMYRFRRAARISQMTDSFDQEFEEAIQTMSESEHGPKPVEDHHLEKWLKGAQEVVDSNFRKNGYSQPSPVLKVEHGKRYSRIVSVQRHRDESGEVKETNQRSAHAFIDRTNGDVLKPAGWKAPAKHARGNVHDEHGGLKHMGPYGPAYLR